MTSWSIRRNASLAVLDKLLDRLGMIDRSEERKLTNDYVRKLNVATDSIDKRVVNLSGGNQQKIVVAKWLATGPEILILNDPTRGIDVGAKSEIYALCDELARGGLALLFTSSEIEETLGVCDRILVFHKGRVIREFARGEASKADVLHWIAGGTAADVARVEAAEGEAAADMYRDFMRGGGILNDVFMSWWWPNTVLNVQHGVDGSLER